jgi:hypothetical protein
VSILGHLGWNCLKCACCRVLTSVAFSRILYRDVRLSDPVSLPTPASTSVRRLEKLSPKHEAIINLLVQDPTVRQYEIAERLGYTPSWVSSIMASAVFKERLLERQAEIVDPILFASIQERFEGMLLRLIEVINEKLNAEHVPDRFALRAFELALRAAGYSGGKEPGAGLSGQTVHQHLDSMATNLVKVLRSERSKVVMTVETQTDSSVVRG